jgi:hypothetical protein
MSDCVVAGVPVKIKGFLVILDFEPLGFKQKHLAGSHLSAIFDYCLLWI